MGVAAVLLVGLALAQSGRAADSAPVQGTTPRAEDAPIPPPPLPPEIPPQLLPPAPSAGKGRLALMIGGNRRWCTYPDDRIVRPPQKQGRFEKMNEVITFGYQFSLAAVRRGQAIEPLMLYSSPIYSTASWIPAFKLGPTQKNAPSHPVVVGDEALAPRQKKPPKGPDTLVPVWKEQNRCVTMPERMDFDLDPGTYDVYMAFDLLTRDNVWVHRAVGYMTDVPIEADRRTRLDGWVNLAGGSDRQVELQGLAIEPSATASPAAPGP